MSHNCKSTFSAPTRDANNNTLYHGGTAPGFGGRGYTPPSVNSNKIYHQQMTTKALIGSMTAINDLKVQEKAVRDVRRTH